ncbi:CHAT domain-containing protein [Nostoc sp. MG11]|uniref:CHAT domain-containing protein n=1 Tax=Nostoc sp. MG11 TaxID=2721166 RepID=UPI0029FF06AF|nr:CHAT domain-containing protein [Nostoc sp. MG11]
MSNRDRQLNKRRFLGFLFLCSLIFFTWLNHAPLMANIVTSQNTDISQQVEQGVKSYEAGDIWGAIETWQKALDAYKKANNAKNAAVVSENLARAYQQLGDTKEAIAFFNEAITYYSEAKDLRQVGRMLTDLAQTYNNQGQARKAISLLCSNKFDIKSDTKQPCESNSALQIALTNKDSRTEVAALGILGEALRLVGNYDLAIQYLEDAAKVKDSGYAILINNSLGNVHVNLGQLWYIRAKSAEQTNGNKAEEFQQNAIVNFTQAIKYFKISLELARKQNNSLSQLQALLNTIQVSYKSHDLNIIPNAAINSKIQEAISLIDRVPDSSTKAYGAIDLAMLPSDFKITSPITQCSKTGELGKLSNTEAIDILNKAIIVSKKIQNSRVESYTYGALGHFWECRGDELQALKYTQQALIAADQKLAAKDGLYLWEWQAGRILKKQNQEKESLEAYQRAFKILETIRSDIVTSTRDVQFDFRDVVQPLYRELAEFQLQQILQASVKSDSSKSGVSDALETIDSLKLAELQNYFGGDCIVNVLNPKRVDEIVDNNTAVLSSIIFDDKIALLLTLPPKVNQSGETLIYWVQADNKILQKSELQKQIKAFQKSLILGQGRPDGYDRTLAIQLYDLIIRPFVKDLKAAKIKTLVFVQDGFLRSIPMAALYDAKTQEYLIQQYAVGTTPSIRLTAPKSSDRHLEKALILGLTKAAIIDKQEFGALDYADKEIEAVKQVFPNSRFFIDTKFASETLRTELGNKNIFPIVHIVSHAQFGTIPEDTFIVTGNNSKLTINELEAALSNVRGQENALELLVLTACQTALGDDRATLGLAGVALQVGVKSAVASLWSVQDKSTALLVEEFYRNLKKPGMTKVEALRQAQIKMIKLTGEQSEFASPAFWSPFILIGNWV